MQALLKQALLFIELPQSLQVHSILYHTQVSTQTFFHSYDNFKCYDFFIINQDINGSLWKD